MIIGMWEYWGDGHDLLGRIRCLGYFLAFMGGVWWGCHWGMPGLRTGKWKFGIFNNFLSSRALPTGCCNFVNVLRRYTDMYLYWRFWEQLLDIYCLCS